MTVPTMAANGGIYKLRWGPEQITIRIDRLSEDAKYSTTGEILVETTAPGSPPHLHQARFNLTSTQARRTLALHLAERMNSLDWHAIIEQASVLVLQRHRAGNPVVQVSSHRVSEHLPFRLAPFLQERQATLLFGHGDTGKSFVALYWAVLIAHGVAHNGFVPEQGNVLYIDYETDEDTIAERVQMICAGPQWEVPTNLYCRYSYQTIAADIESVQRHVLDKDIECLIIDSATPAVGEAESATMTAEFFRALWSLRITTLTIAHVAKGGKENEPFGSIFWRNLPRSNWRVNATHEAGDPTFTVGLRHTKSNNGQRLADIGLELKFAGNALTLAKVDVAGVPELAEGLSARTRIAALLKRGALRVQNIQEELDLTQSTVSVTLLRGSKGDAPIFIRIDKDLWGLRA